MSSAIATGTTPSAMAASALGKSSATTRCGACGIVMSPASCSMVNGKGLALAVGEAVAGEAETRFGSGSSAQAVSPSSANAAPSAQRRG